MGVGVGGCLVGRSIALGCGAVEERVSFGI